ncbi:uncharacterized protein LOC131879551 [Tigriopus californicus]|uniref:uncharacterized protein LOC131879551 n=1 Tax=Tigriopus californicus TaxID=6832 RepID=UPI0027DA68BE|nr:uncharacterized protein LOC131879551 [Tigriopus californicus]
MEKPAKRKTIQVCFKHPDLLKQAREACVARREDGRPPHPSPHDAERSDPLPLRPRLPRETDVFAHTEVSGVSPAATTHVLCHPLPYPTAPPPVPVERKGLIPLPPLEVLNPTEPTTPPKVMCIQFDDNDIVDDSTGFQAEPAIPDCTTTQGEIEVELNHFLASYCSICKKDRGGKLCGCAFPCSLTFRSQMLLKIHDLLQMEKPAKRKTIQRN